MTPPSPTPDAQPLIGRLGLIGLLALLAILTMGGVYAVTRARNTPAASPVPAATHDAARATRATVHSEGLIAAYPGADVTVGAEHGGRVVRLLVGEHSTVAAGALVAEMDASDDRARLDEARAQVTESEATIRQLEADTARLTSLVKDRAATTQALDRATRDLDGARARRASLAATVSRLELSIAKALIHAPIAGTVTALYASSGEIIAPGARLLRLTDLSRLRVEAEVDEFDAPRVRSGAPVTIRAEGYPGRSWHGAVEEVPVLFVTRRLTPQDPGRSADGQVLLVKIAPREAVPFWLGQRVDAEIDVARADSAKHRPEP